MHNTNDLEGSNFHIELLIYALKYQDKAIVEIFEDFLTTLFEPEYTTDILTAAVFKLAETDPYSCRWALRNFYDLKLHSDIKEGAIMFATQKIIGLGFILGQDFSVTANGGIIINKYAKAALREGTSASDWLFLEEILQLVD